MVKPYKVRVEIKGEVKNPAIYEIKDNEHISDVIDFAGGYTDKAYSYRLKVVRNTDKDYKIIDVENKQFASFSLENGDILTIDSILNVFENRVEIRGAVVRPGQYELTKGMTLKDLINIKAEGLKGDAFLSRAIIYRTNPDYSISSFPGDLAAIFKGQAEDILLQKEDILRVFSIYELQEGYNFTIDGEVNKPGTYPYIKEFSLGDLIASAGGFSESASLAKIEVARRIKNSDPLSKSAQIADVFQFNVSKDLNLSDSASKFILQPFDQVIIRRSPGYEIQKLAYVYGEVQYPGSYIIKTKEEYLSDLITRAGGLRAEAFPKGAYLTRLVISDPVLRAKALNALRKSNDKESAEVPGNETEQIIGINLDKILEDPHSKYDLILQEGDVLKIPKELQTVKISGDLLYPVTVRFDNSIGLKSYISMAGGYGQEAKPSKTFVIYANGMVKRTKRFMGIKFYPKVEPGAEIFVPTKIKQEAKSTWSIQETAILVSMFTSLGTMAATLAYLFKK